MMRSFKNMFGFIDDLFIWKVNSSKAKCSYINFDEDKNIE